MISDQLTTGTPKSAPDAPRLAMKPDAALGGLVDGAWWPRSTDPAAEFPGLIAALDAGGPISRVTYHLDDWDATARRLTVGGSVVRMEGFRYAAADSVALLRANRGRIRLLVIPPDTTEDEARAVLRDASSAQPGFVPK
ncbi:DUF5994 family protein [Actinokineospora sp. G85]|uniref:DUF5994 family protein n=1 Tax=Actinokineospora sp. G85 TaxID=3406626 RepID=UPI003C76BBAC